MLEPLITHCDASNFDAAVAFIANLNGNAGDHIGYFDTAAADIARGVLRSLGEEGGEET